MTSGPLDSDLDNEVDAGDWFADSGQYLNLASPDTVDVVARALEVVATRPAGMFITGYDEHAAALVKAIRHLLESA